MPPLAPGETPAPPHHHAFRAMNCAMAAWVVCDDETAARQALADVEGFMQATEAALSRFRPDSDLSRLNAQTGREVEISPLLAEVLSLALVSAHGSHGLYDPTILAALESAGYDRSFEAVTDTPWPTSSPQPVHASWRDIRLDTATRHVFLPAGLRLDLGGIAKGWAADQAAKRLAALGSCLVDAGGDIVARGRPAAWPAWPVAIADPRDPEADLALLMLTERGIATSGTDYRRWRRAGALQHHIIDPRRRRPAQTDLLSVTVIAPSAVAADVHAKVTLILGADAGRHYLEGLLDIEGLLVTEAGEVSMTKGLAGHAYAETPCESG